LCVVGAVLVVVPGVLLVTGVVVEELPDLPPHPATAKVHARTEAVVSIAVSGVLFIVGRAPDLACVLGFSPYQQLVAANAARSPRGRGRTVMSAETTAPPAIAEPPAGEQGAREGGSPWLLAVCCVAQFMVILDLSIVNVALPSIQSSLGFSSPALQWVVDAYAITFAGFLMLGGRAADHFGQRRTFAAALLLFGLASLAGGAAPTQEVLVGARAVQGLAGALMAACSLAIITASFPPGPKLHRAIGLWAAMNGLGGAAGVLLGGIITEVLSWRWVLLINPPIAVAATLVAYAVVRERRRAPNASFDLAGALTLTIGQMVLVYGVVEAGLKGWGTFAALGPIVLGLVLLAAFGAIETRVASSPLIPFKELTKSLRTANTVVLLFSAALFPMWFVSSLYMQQVLGLSPLHTGLVFLPMTLTIMLIARQAGKLVGRFGVRTVLGSGLLMLTGGLLLFTRIGVSGSPIVYVIIPGVLTAAGIAMAIVPSTIAATQGAKEGQAGLASGLVNTSRQIGGGLGLALLITLATQRTTHLIGSGQQVSQALTHGFVLAYLIGAGLAATAAIITFTALPKPPEALRGPARRFAFAIAAVLAVFVALTAAFAGSHGAPLGAYTTRGAYSFVTAPTLHPPKIRATYHAPSSALAPGYIFTANFYDLNEPPIVGQSGPLILDRNLQPVWFEPVPEKVVASNLSLQTYEGKPALAWWQGRVTNTGATETGEDVVVNSHYQKVATLKATGGWVLTLHEFLISGEDAWVTANRNIPIDLSKYGGAYNGALVDSAVQEYNLKTGKLLRSWDALDHIPLSESQATLPTNGFPWDAYHVNAIDLTGNGTFLVSMRDTWAAYLVDIATGKIEWTLGGKNSSFKFGPGAAFKWQHDVELQSGSTVSLFDDHCCQLTGGGTYVAPSAPSRGLVLKLDQQARTATLSSQYSLGSDFDAEYMGDTQPLANGNVLVGWGSEPYFSEFARGGKLLAEGELPGPDLTYRATLEQWTGLPLTPPAGTARTQGGKTTVYASWNGSTEVASWRVLAGAGAGGGTGAGGESGAGSGTGSATARLTAVATAAKAGFETAIPVPPSAAQSDRSFEVQALNAHGRAIAVSRPFSGAGR
jgi:EmrB/QacA subfamily drug resistance transporter